MADGESVSKAYLVEKLRWYELYTMNFTFCVWTVHPRLHGEM